MKSNFFFNIFIIMISLSYSMNNLYAQQVVSNDGKELQQEKLVEEFKGKASQLNADLLAKIATQNNGRIKPLDSLARETLLFVTGKYSRWGLSASQIYISLLGYKNAQQLDLIEVRDPDLRVEIGFSKAKRLYSLEDLQASQLESLAGPHLNKEQKNKNTLTEKEKKIIETYSQMATLREIISGNHIFQAIDFTDINNSKANPIDTTAGHQKIQTTLSQFVAALQNFFNQPANNSSEIDQQIQALAQITRSQPVPELFQHYLDSLDTEILFNKARFFFYACLLALMIGFIFILPFTQNKMSHKTGLILMALVASPLVIGLAFRVYITRFAPVTNMYGTLIWVSLGVTLFATVLFSLYKSFTASGALMMGSGILLLLTEQIPLVISPEMDPVVAVLRNNFWLSTHVTTITISYSAFTIAMIMGNIALIRMWTHKDNTAFFKEYSHYAYRMIQLGCFLLTVGIILGGVWADYSWGRFWGWDPKETWALIADLGFLSILHARYVGWVDSFTLLAWSPIAYLLVIMAWFGVNFILASGLHSYGFSTGGATMTAAFVAVQLVLLIAAFIRFKTKKTPAATN